MLKKRGNRIILLPDRKLKIRKRILFGMVILLFVCFTVLYYTGVINWGDNPNTTASPSPKSAQTPVSTTKKPAPIKTLHPTPTLPPATPIPSYDYNSPVPASTAVEDSFFQDAVFIGDSRMEGFMLYSGLSVGEFFTHKGLMVNTAFTQAFIKTETDEKLTVTQALGRKSYNKVYIMLGINELGWSYSSVFIQKYGELIDEIRKSQPQAQIYIESIMPVTAQRSKEDKIYNNEKIEEYNQLILQMCAQKQVFYVNVAETMTDKDGALFADAATDGIHLTKKYCMKWLEYLRAHAVQ